MVDILKINLIPLRKSNGIALNLFIVGVKNKI